MSIIEEFTAGLAQLQTMQKFKLALGRAMTVEQTHAVGNMIDDKTLEPAFEHWLDTDDGRAATRAYFAAFLKTKTPPEGGANRSV